MQRHRTSEPDSLSRRRRYAAASTGKRVIPQARDLVWFEKLHRHGSLSTATLHAYTKQICKSLSATKHRLTDLFHEDVTPHGGAYLVRPPQQFATYDARLNDMVYDLAPAAEAALRQAGLWRENAPTASSISWKHDFMVSHVTSSIELGTLMQPNHYRYMFQDEILGRIGVPLRFDVPFTYKHPRTGRLMKVDRPLIPDRIFGIEYLPDRTMRLFFVEADCATEPLRASSFNRKSYRRNALQYREFIGGGLYKQALMISGGVMLINLTTSIARMQNMMELVDEVSGGKGNTYFMFACLPDFVPIFRPSRPMPELLTRSWSRSSLPEFNISLKE